MLSEEQERVQARGDESCAFDVDAFLSAEADKDLLRFSTAGSVDDGKSTLIGRLLYDSRNVYEDQVRAVTGTQVGHNEPAIDFARLTDGLRAEREQGITIDVAYRYFSTRQRKFIIADTPGHEQYTRNMATGASTADLAIILIDARKGILTQSRRHAYIASLLGVRSLVGAINKMDLVDFSEEIYRKIESEFRALVRSFGITNEMAIPVSALLGDNVVEQSDKTPWYSGPTLLEHLESVPIRADASAQAWRLPIQRVIRPDQTYRGFAGQISAGTVRKGDTVIALPSGRTSRIASITTFDGDLEEASAPLSIAVTLEDELDISRGDLLAEPARLPQQARTIEASLVWFDGQSLEPNHSYLVKHGAQTLPAQVTRVRYRTNITTLAEEAVNSLQMNDVGVVEIELTRVLFFDAYLENRASGSFILIDPHTNATLAAGIIRRGLRNDESVANNKAAVVHSVMAAHSEKWMRALEEALIETGAAVVRTRVVAERTLRGLLSLGLIVLVDGAVDDQTELSLSGSGFATIDAATFANERELIGHLLAVDVLKPQKKGSV